MKSQGSELQQDVFPSSITSITFGKGVTTMPKLSKYQSITHLTVSESIPDAAYESHSIPTNTKLTHVTIEGSATSIGKYAFAQHWALTHVTIGNSVTTIGPHAFAWSSVTHLTIGKSVTTIGISAFMLTKLSYVTIPDSVTSIGDAAFQSIRSGAGYAYGPDHRRLGFVPSPLTHVTFGKSVTTIGRMAFMYTLLTHVTIPDSVTTIGDNAFSSVPTLTRVTIGKSVTTIGGGAFMDTKLTHVTIPDSVTTIGDYAFMTSQHHVHGIPAPPPSTLNVTIGKSVTSIGNNAFSGTNLIHVTIPDSVVSIGADAFFGTPLTHVALPQSVKNLGDNAFPATTAVTYQKCGQQNDVTVGFGITPRSCASSPGQDAEMKLLKQQLKDVIAAVNQQKLLNDVVRL
jgi:hypothetical protein